MRGEEVGARYRLRRRLGEGSQGEVWRARDTVVGADVAVKLLTHPVASQNDRREMMALRLLRIPGVVGLLDEGVHRGQPFLVTELVEGTPFPGRPIPCAWDDLAPVFTRLLEVVDRVHAQGVLHLDLKPGNVLVTEDNAPMILDFGISRMSARPLEAIPFAGTPAYLAPEQLRGSETRPATDLYAIGAMAYQALTGETAHDTSDPRGGLRALMYRRLVGDAPSFSHIRGLPDAIAKTLESMLEPDEAARPASAFEVLQKLRGRAVREDLLPWLGPTDLLDEACARLDRAERVTLSGPPGMGSSRVLREVARRYEERGRNATSLPRADAAFASLTPVVGTLAPAERDAAEITRRLRDHVREGGVLLIDDESGLDPESRAVIDALGDAPVLVAKADRVGSDALELRPIDEEALRELFVGPERLFHLCTDSARLLAERTAGRPARVVEELEAWETRGLAHRDGVKFQVSREAIDALRTSPSSRLGGGATIELPTDLQDLLVWIELLDGAATVATLTTLTASPRPTIEAQLEELTSEWLVTVRGERVRCCEPLDVHSVWHSPRIDEARRRIVDMLPAGSPSRLFHLMNDPQAAPRAVAQEALATARRELHAGRYGAALAVLEAGVRFAGDGELTAEREELLVVWLGLAASDRTTAAADRLLYELSRIPSPTPAAQRCTELAHVLLELSSEPLRALERLEALGELPSVLEGRRAHLRMVAAYSASADVTHRVLAETEEWARRDGHADTLALLDGWRGRAQYRAGAYAAAAKLHLCSAEALEAPLDALLAENNAASALLEDFKTSEAERIARCARDTLVAEFRYPHLEARTEWILRVCLYRKQVPTGPDLELIEAVGALGIASLDAQVCMTEAAFAWRAGRLSSARTLAARAERGWRSLHMFQEFQGLARALAILCGAKATDAEILSIVSDVDDCETMGASIQVAGLLALARPGLIPAERALEWARTVPSAHWSSRVDVLSVDEARAALDA